MKRIATLTALTALLLGTAAALAQGTGQCPAGGCSTIPPPPVCTVTSRTCQVDTAGRVSNCVDTVSACPVPLTPPTKCVNSWGMVVACP